MVPKLVSATPSPFARINRIALIEKGIEFEVVNEVPWDSTTQTPEYNPLEKLPILIFDDGSVIYDSAYIQDYITEKFTQGPSLLPESLDDKLKARQIQVLAEGMMDSMALNFFEQARGDKMSTEWFARQSRKVAGGMKALNEMVKSSSGEYLVDNTYTIADIAAATVVGFIDFANGIGEFGDMKTWRSTYPELEKYWLNLEERESFKQTKLFMFEIQDKIV